MSRFKPGSTKDCSLKTISAARNIRVAPASGRSIHQSFFLAKDDQCPSSGSPTEFLGMIAAIVGMFALLMGGGIAGVYITPKKRKGQILKQTPAALKRIANPPQHKRQLKKRRPIRTPQTLFPSLLPERERLPVLNPISARKTPLYSPDSEEPTWTEFLTDGSANTADFNGQAQYTIEGRASP